MFGELDYSFYSIFHYKPQFSTAVVVPSGIFFSFLLFLGHFMDSIVSYVLRYAIMGRAILASDV